MINDNTATPQKNRDLIDLIRTSVPKLCFDGLNILAMTPSTPISPRTPPKTNTPRQPNNTPQQNHQTQRVSQFPTPRNSRLSSIHSHNNNNIRLHEEQLLIRRLSQDIKKTLEKTILAIGMARQTDTNICKLQAHFRRRRQMYNPPPIYINRIHYKQLQKESRYRKAIYFEILTTESIYVEDLKLMEINYIQQLEKKKIMKAHEILKCFTNIKQIISLNDEMFKSLQQQTWHPNKQMLSTILEFAPFFKIYFEYCNNFPVMMQSLKKFTQENQNLMKLHVEIRKSPLFRLQDIDSFLVKPIQRLPKYVLLLKEYLKHTNHSHPDYQNIVKALQIFERVTQDNNMHMDKIFNNQKMFELARLFSDHENLQIINPKRNFIFEEPMTVFWKNQSKSVIGYVLSDLILLAERDIFSQLNKLELLQSIFLGPNSFCKAIVDHELMTNLIYMMGENEGVTFIYDSGESQQQTLNKFNQILSELKENKTAVLDKFMQVSSIHKQPKLKIEIAVVGTEERMEKLIKYTIYIIDVDIERISSKVFLRYSEFQQLQDRIRQDFPSLRLPYSNDHTIFNTHSNRIIEQRKLSIQVFMQTLFGNPKFYQTKQQEQLNQVLKYVGLPLNFYDLPRILLENTKNQNIFQSGFNFPSSRNSEYHIEEEQKVAMTIQTIQSFNQNLIKQQSLDESYERRQSMCQKLSQTSKQRSLKRVSSVKLAGNTGSGEKLQRDIAKHTLLVKLCTEDIPILISDDCRSIEVVQEISNRIGLQQFYDFRLYDERTGRIILDDEIIMNIFRRKRLDQGFLNQFEFIQKMKDYFLDKPTVLFRKVLYIPKQMEAFEYFHDNVRLGLLVSQLNQTHNFGSEQSIFSALYLYIESVDKNNDRRDSNSDRKNDRKENRNISNQVNELLSSIKQHMMQLNCSSTNEQIAIAQRLIMDLAAQQPLYGMEIYEVQSVPNNQPQTIGININGFHLILHKKVVKTFKACYISNIKAYPNQISFTYMRDKNLTHKFITLQGYQMYYLFEEYCFIQEEIEYGELEKENMDLLLI